MAGVQKVDKPLVKALAEAANNAGRLAFELERARFPDALKTPNLYPTAPDTKEARRR